MDKPKTYVSGGPQEEEHQDNPSGTTHQRDKTRPEDAHERIKKLRESLKGNGDENITG